jgi:RNA polymerase sigma-70 factor (ECF subfamily)
MSASSRESSEDWLLETLERFEKPLLKYTLAICGNRELARDIVQEAFLRLAMDAQTERPRNLSAWLFTVCRNKLVDVRRKQFRLVPLKQEHLENPEELAPAPSAGIQAREETALLLEMVEGLAERERELIRLKFQAGLSYREIAEVTGLTEGHIGYLLHHAVKTLREAWREEGQR